MPINLKLVSVAALLFCAGVACDATTTTESEVVDEAAVAQADPDREPQEVKTPLDQSEDADDVRITAEIRRAVIAHDSLSTNADNAKIITEGHAVTLAGVVDSTEEKATLEQIARGVAGVTQVDNQLQINPQ